MAGSGPEQRGKKVVGTWKKENGQRVPVKVKATRVALAEKNRATLWLPSKELGKNGSATPTKKTGVKARTGKGGGSRTNKAS